jgi:hypothetical protein
VVPEAKGFIESPKVAEVQRLSSLRRSVERRSAERVDEEGDLGRFGG